MQRFVKCLVTWYVLRWLVSVSPKPKLQDHPLSAVRHSSFNIFVATFRTTPFRLSATAHSIYSQLPSGPPLVGCPPLLIQYIRSYLQDHPLSAVRHCSFNILAATFRPIPCRLSATAHSIYSQLPSGPPLVGCPPQLTRYIRSYLQDHPLSAVRHSSLNIFAATFRTTPCRLSATAYSIYSQLPSASGCRLLHPQPEDAPCRPDRLPSVISWFILSILKTSHFCYSFWFRH